MTFCVKSCSGWRRQESVEFFKGSSDLGIKGTVTVVLIEALLNMKVAGPDAGGKCQ
jgi:hypothetical protein